MVPIGTGITPPPQLATAARYHPDPAPSVLASSTIPSPIADRTLHPPPAHRPEPRDVSGPAELQNRIPGCRRTAPRHTAVPSRRHRAESSSTGPDSAAPG